MSKCIVEWCWVCMMMLQLVTAMPSSISNISSTSPTVVSTTSTPSSTTTTTTTTTARGKNAPISETIQHLAQQLMQLNATSHLTFDTRTPPKLREQTRREHSDFGHPGVAEPVDEEAALLEEENKHMNMNFYKVVKPTTDSSGLSTWILLSGQSSTNKPTKKPVVQLKNATDDKVIKPIFKRKSTTTTTTTTTKKPTALLSTTLKATISTATTLTTEKPEKTTKINKGKITPVTIAPPKKVVTSRIPQKSTKGDSVAITTTATLKTTTGVPTTSKSEFVKVPTKSSNSSSIQPEAKEGAIDLTPEMKTDKKNKRPTVASAAAAAKRKKNKNRRKKPVAEDKMDKENNTKVSGVNKLKEKPIGTQIYNYLSREVMPTVGVGLVGLVVTAGLASYFLYPFGPLRRSYEIDRKDKEGPYHYTDEYSGGIAEEEAIGKVIAGMPSNTYYNTRSQNSRNTYNMNDYNSLGGNRGGSYQPYPNRFRNVEQRFMEGSVETVALNPMTTYKTEEIIIGSPKKKHPYSNHKETYDSIDPNKLNEQQHSEQFVVGNIPQEISGQAVQDTTESATPSVVPEHGPRTLEELQGEEQEKVFVVESVPAQAEALYAPLDHGPRRRRRRNTPRVIEKQVIDNEIDVSDEKVKKPSTSTSAPTSSTTFSINEEATKETLYDTTTTMTTTVEENWTTTQNPIVEKTETIFGLVKDLIYLKLRLGLQLLHDKAQSLSRYFAHVQERIDATYKNVNVNQTITYS